MKNPKLLLYWLTLLSIYGIACSQAPNKEPKVQLEQLRKQQAELSSKIRNLENKETVAGIIDSALINFKQVAISPVQVVDFVHTIEVQGKVESDQNIEVNPKIAGIITKIQVTEGQKVAKGQVLATIDNQILQGNLEQVKSQYSLAKILYEKQKNLWDQQIGTEVQYLQAKNTKENLEKNMEVLRDQLSQTNIVSPINGTVDQIMARLGQTASTGAAQFRIVNTTVLKIQAGLGENYISRVMPGYPISINFPDIGKIIKAKVDFVSRVIDPITRTFLVQTKLSGQTGIRPNMVAILEIQDYRNPSAMVVPIGLVQKSEEGSYVYVALKGKNPKFGTAKRKSVVVGQIQDGKAEIKSGLDRSDLVITLGYQGLSDGTSIAF